jgi:hypothetical protein
MTIKYVMTHDEGLAHTASLIPDACAKNDSKEDIAFDLAIEFGIITGLVSGGWYPDEAVGHLIDREEGKGNLEESDLEQFEQNKLAYHKKMQENNEKGSV